ncbi:MAG: YraN family protein [Saprospirales bacterium]|nr:MAG: YraN family protein [Saprospirales bacterium]
MSKKKGDWGEKIAKSYLEKKGIEVVETNWRVGHLELDIIAEDGDVLVFVEVKLRSWGGPLEAKYSMTEDQINRLAKAAHCYMVHNERDGEVRFDLVAVTYYDEKNYRTQHVEDAFFPGSIL